MPDVLLESAGVRAPAETVPERSSRRRSGFWWSDRDLQRRLRQVIVFVYGTQKFDGYRSDMPTIGSALGSALRQSRALSQLWWNLCRY